MAIADDLQRHQSARRFALCQVQIRHWTRCNAPDAAIASNERAPETLRVATDGTRAPLGPRPRLQPLGILQHLKESLGIDLVAADDRVCSDLPRLGQIG